MYSVGRSLVEEALRKWEHNFLMPRGGRITCIWYLGKGFTCVMVDSRVVRDRVVLWGETIINDAYVYMRPWGEDFDLDEVLCAQLLWIS